MATADTLNELLGRGYHAMVRGTAPIALVLSDFKDASADDAALIPAAEQRLNELSAIEPRKCFVSQTHANFLRLALNQ